MSMLVLAALVFLVTHLGISSTPVRGMLIGVMGENIYLGFYSLLAAVTLGALIYAWLEVGPTEIVWSLGVTGTAIARALMPIALILLVAGLMAKNPTAVKMDAAVSEEIPGILKVTRHPVQWAIFLWATAHLMSNGDQASIVFFGTFAVLAGIGTIALDKKHGARQEQEWQHFYAVTSNVPFLAVITGRTRLQLSEQDWLAIGVGVVLFVGLYMFHDLVSGVSLY
ncbi:MAG: NnrU family protein [Pseudomonadales bacterium]